jgi:hypothetical protein
MTGALLINKIIYRKNLSVLQFNGEWITAIPGRAIITDDDLILNIPCFSFIFTYTASYTER